MKNIYFGINFVVLLLLLVGCSSAPKVERKFIDPDFSLNDHSIVFLARQLNGVRINGNSSINTNLSASWGFENFVLLPPGQHIIGAQYYATEGNYTYSAPYMEIEFDFKPGRVYYFNATRRGNSITLNVLDQTDPFIFTDSWFRLHCWQRIENAKHVLWSRTGD